jgi:hypothetical protein
MNVRPLPVTILCATRNSCDAVRLTVRSLLRHTPPVARILVADNGSTDGTLEWLREVNGIEVVTLDERARVLADEHAWRRSVAAALARRGAGSTATARRFLDDGAAPPVPSTEHGATLDWLVAQATTPYVVTLDSDVELLADGWLETALAVVHRDGLAAFGSLERGRGRYRRRLALISGRTKAVRRVNGTFRGPSVATILMSALAGAGPLAIDFDDLVAFGRRRSPAGRAAPRGSTLRANGGRRSRRHRAALRALRPPVVADGGDGARAAVRERLLAYELA